MTAQAQGIRPRSVFCVTEHAYQSRAVAEAVAEGFFTHAGIRLELGLEPDWLTAELPADAEWRIEWSKFYYGLDLAHAYVRTGDEKFPRAWERLVSSWMRQVPVGFDTSDVTGRRVQNWIYAWASFASAACFRGFSEGFEERLLESLAAQVKHIRGRLTAGRNHRTLELYALYIAALALPELEADDSLLDFAVAELHQNLLADIRPDGVQREHSTHYHMLVLRSFLGVCENARRFGLSLPEGFAGHVERACEFAMHSRRPDGLIPALSDSDTGDYADILELAACLFARPDFLYAASAGERGLAPRRKCVSFPEGGYFVQRSDWGEGGVGENDGDMRAARFLIFDCGPLGDGGHGHYDALNVEIAARGRALVVDPGRYTYSEHGPVNWRRWFKSTSAHNTVCVDGLDQTPYRAGKPKGETARALLLERLGARGLDVLCGSVESPAYDAKHTRRVFFVAGEYWLIFDDLRGRVAHDYDLRFHLAPEAEGRTSISREGANASVRAPGLALIFESSSKPRIEAGWVAPRYGVKLPAPVVGVMAEGTADARFLTLVAPVDADAPAPTFQARVKAERTIETLSVEILGVGRGGAAIDRIVWSAGPGQFELGSFSVCASAAWLRTTVDGKEQTFSACNVLDLKRTTWEMGRSLIETRPLARVTWDARRGFRQDEGSEP